MRVVCVGVCAIQREVEKNINGCRTALQCPYPEEYSLTL